MDEQEIENEELLKVAKIKAARYCAYQERCQKEVRNKLYTLGLNTPQVEELLAYFITEGFVNEERFARSFAGGKFRVKSWGKMKIIRQLKSREISDYCIEKALTEIGEEEYFTTLNNLISKRNDQGVEDVFVRRDGIAKYLINKGYEPDLVWAHLKALIPE